MPISTYRFACIAFLLAAVLFWSAWFLMPEQGTADPDLILRRVYQKRSAVLYSVIIQIVSSAAYLISLILLVKILRAINNVGLSGSILLAMGLHKGALISGRSAQLHVLVIIVAVIGGILVNKVLGYGHSSLALCVLGLFSIAQIFIASELLIHQQIVFESTCENLLSPSAKSGGTERPHSKHVH